MSIARRDEAATDTGPIGPVAISAFLILLATSPIMRGGNRQVALIVLEGVALAFLVAALAGARATAARWSLSIAVVVFIAASPLWLAAIYLVPIPADWWRAAAGREAYLTFMANAGVAVPERLPLSLMPDATASSLFAGIPIAAAFLAGYCMRIRQLRLSLRVLVGVAFFEVLVGLLQMAGGSASSLYFGSIGGRPFGTFANPNHFANYVAMALAGYVWLASIGLARNRHLRRAGRATRLQESHALALWCAGGVVLALGVLMSGSRGAAIAGLPAAVCAVTLAMASASRFRSLRSILLVVLLGMAVVLTFMGGEAVIARFNTETMHTDSSFRELLSSTTLHGAAQFWPWGAGWGTYVGVYPRFQPAAVAGIADHAHDDFAQLLFEGGIFSVLLMLAVGYLAVTRAVLLARRAVRNHRLSREELAAALCGLGLLGFLVHSFVDFNMHIPANAITAALLAGAYLRPLAADGADDSADPEEGDDD